MSKSNKTTKFATFVGYMADFGQEVEACGGALDYAHRVSDGAVLIQTSCGLAAWSSGFQTASPGDRVVLRKNAPRSHGDMPWVMTGRAN